MNISKAVTFQNLPPEYPHSLLPEIQRMVQAAQRKIVVLDDDPTGTQTVRQVAVLTRWDVNSLIRTFQESDAVLYILTNSRSFLPDIVEEINREIARNLKLASTKTGRPFVLVSRSDSTLRGHFPLEIDVLINELQENFAGILLIPFFEEGGRFTINDIHYVAEGDWLIPAAETEYARDATFGYQHSNLREWVLEKTSGRIHPEQIVSIDLDTLRLGGPTAVMERLMKLSKEQVCIVNAVSYRDLEVFVAGLLLAEATGKRFIYRTAASFVRVRSGLDASPLLTSADFNFSEGTKGGLIIAGSYIQKSSEQIAAVLTLPNVVGIEVSVPRLLQDEACTIEIEQAVERVNSSLKDGKEAIVYTSRELFTGGNAAESLQIGQVVSEVLVEIVRGLEIRPAWIVAKGGITSSDIATKGLEIARARVMGQILPGVPVWEAAEGSRWSGLVYVVFPGNVGGTQAIAQAVEILTHARKSN